MTVNDHMLKVSGGFHNKLSRRPWMSTMWCCSWARAWHNLLYIKINLGFVGQCCFKGLLIRLPHTAVLALTDWIFRSIEVSQLAQGTITASTGAAGIREPMAFWELEQPVATLHWVSFLSLCMCAVFQHFIPYYGLCTVLTGRGKFLTSFSIARTSHKIYILN